MRQPGHYAGEAKQPNRHLQKKLQNTKITSSSHFKYVNVLFQYKAEEYQ